MPPAVLTSTLSTSLTFWRSSSRRRTTIGYSFPAWRNSAACVPDDVGANRVRERRGADAEQRGLGPVDADRQLRTSFVAPEARIGDTRRVVEEILEGLRELLRVVRDLRRESRARAGRRRCCRRPRAGD